MSENRVKCTECEHMILPATASRNNGLCAVCVQISPEQRQASRAFNDWVKAGDLKPMEEALSQAVSTEYISPLGTQWSVDSSLSTNTNMASLQAIIELGLPADEGYIYLRSSHGSVITLAFNPKYIVCEYNNETTGESLFAYTDANLNRQVDKALHIEQLCFCCGVGLFYYSSHCHIPREYLETILSGLTDGNSNTTIQWLPFADLSNNTLGMG